VSKAIVSIDADLDALEVSKVKYQDEIVDIQCEMQLAWNAEKILIAEAHSTAASFNMYGGMPQPQQGSREGSGQATPSLGRYKAWRGDKLCQPKLLTADIQPSKLKRWRASMEGYLGVGTETGASPVDGYNQIQKQYGLLYDAEGGVRLDGHQHHRGEPASHRKSVLQVSPFGV
jgi:hypothetical protein